MCSVTRSVVSKFLLEVKTTLQKTDRKNPTWTLSTVREKNLATLSELEMKVQAVRDVILSLTPENYCAGPLKDRTFKGELWEFGTVVKGSEVYIKIKLTTDKHGSSVRVLSFHRPERPLAYYFREQL